MRGHVWDSQNWSVRSCGRSRSAPRAQHQWTFGAGRAQDGRDARGAERVDRTRRRARHPRRLRGGSRPVTGCSRPRGRGWDRQDGALGGGRRSRRGCRLHRSRSTACRGRDEDRSHGAPRPPRAVVRGGVAANCRLRSGRRSRQRSSSLMSGSGPIAVRSAWRRCPCCVRSLPAGPIVVALDDAQWIDAPSTSALVFAVRRLDELPVALLLAVRSADSRSRASQPSQPRSLTTGCAERELGR